MNVRQDYEKFTTPKNLQEHMLRVAVLSKIIFNKWTGPTINENAVLKACALHDVAKPITFDIAKQAQYGMPPKDIENLEKLQKFIIGKYGIDEHKASVGICKDLGMEIKAIEILENIEWKYIPDLFKTNNIEPLVAIYCDMRIGPKGILTMQERINDLKKRVGEGGYNYKEFEKDGKDLEQKMRENTNIDLN